MRRFKLLAVMLGVVAFSVTGGGAAALNPVGLAPSVASASAVSGADMLQTYRTGDAKQVQLRRGTYDASKGTGFGWTKINKKQGIALYATVGYLLGNPQPEVGGTQAVYSARANKRECNSRGICQVIDSRSVRAVTDIRKPGTYVGSQPRRGQDRRADGVLPEPGRCGQVPVVD